MKTDLNIEKFVRQTIREKGRAETRKELQRMKDYKSKQFPNAVVSLIRDMGKEGLAVLDKHSNTKE